MKLRKIRLENVRSFLDQSELDVDGDISIIIGPNGGGKTNLLDTITTILRRHLIKSYSFRKNPTIEVPDQHELVFNDVLNSSNLEKHTQGVEKSQTIEVDVEVTQQDLDNMSTIFKTAKEITEQTSIKYIGASIVEALKWDLSNVSKGNIFTYRIVNNVLQPVTDGAEVFRQYLGLYEIDSYLRSELGLIALATPMVTFPVNRALNGFQSTVSLAHYNEFEQKRSVDAATSRTPGSIVNLAIGRLAKKYRLLESKFGGADEKFYSVPQIKLLTDALRSLGYEWKLECIDPYINQYDVRLRKQGSSFLVGAASSGEKELLTYLFAIYALNVRDALIVIDEPELHLHPRWQAALLGLFERLSSDTGNQFLLATHSATFISPSSVQYVSRVFSDKQKSGIVRLKSNSLPEYKHLFSIVNSLNNEKMFFSDKVVLVEGISDRIFFDAVFKHLKVSDSSVQTIEVISVGGKGCFESYTRLLNACKVPYVIIADLDFINEIGPPDIKNIFSIDDKKIEEDVIKDPKSKDGVALMLRLDEAILSGKTEDLKNISEYIKSRRRKIRSNLNDGEQSLLREFISEKRKESICILSKGDLESYLPIGFRSKDLKKVIELVNENSWWNLLSEESRCELSEIACLVKELS